MGSIWLRDLDEVLRAAGLEVITEDGWENRSRSSGGLNNLFGVSWHHTASDAHPDNQVHQMCYQSSYKPVAQIGVQKDGIIRLMAAGACNTSGSGRSLQMSRGTIPTDSANTNSVGMEAFNNGQGSIWPEDQINAMFLASNAVNEHAGNKASDLFTHNWYTLSNPSSPAGPARKIDPATAWAVKGPWFPVELANGAGTWENQSVVNEAMARAGNAPPPVITPPPVTPPPPGQIIYDPPEHWGLYPVDLNKKTASIPSGDVHDQVEYLQAVIYWKAGGDCVIDGWFGPKTDKRVRDVQRLFGIAIDGICGWDGSGQNPGKHATWVKIDWLAMQPNSA